MLRFTPEQAAAQNAQRAAWNVNQARIAEQHGIKAIGNAGMIGNASPLPLNVWGMWDKDGITIQRDVLSVFNDLAASVSFPMPIGKLIHYFQLISDSGQVNTSLDGRSKARTDQPTIDYAGTPVPILDTSYFYGWRQMESAMSEGVQLDPAARANALYKIAQRLELQTINGNANINVGGTPLYGLTNHPRRSTRATGVTLAAATGVQWVTEMNATVNLLIAKNFYRPATVYMNFATWRYAQTTDYSAATPFGGTIADRILKDGMIKEVIPASSVPANTIIAVVKDRQVVQILNGMPITNAPQFRANPTDDYDFITMCAAALEIKYDASNQCGVAHSS